MHDHDALDFAELAATLQSAPTPTETAEDIVGYVRAQLDADQAGISVIRSRSRLETIAPTGPLVTELDRLQARLGEGPCYDDAWPSETLTVSDLAEDPRWPAWAAKAKTLGIASLLATELTTVEGRRIGCITAYWTQRRCFTHDDTAFMAIFARHAALALSRAWNEAGLNTALDTRKLGTRLTPSVTRIDCLLDPMFEHCLRWMDGPRSSRQGPVSLRYQRCHRELKSR